MKPLIVLLSFLGLGITATVRAADTTPPTLQTVLPANGATVSNLTSATATFSEAVTTVEAGDFVVNGASALAVSGSGAVRTFTFNQPGPGMVTFGWDGAHTISDLAGNRFDETGPGATWSCTLVDTIAPAVRLTSPAPGATVSALTQIEIIFSEPVTGVDAADLRVNGSPATSVSGTADGPYLFQLTQPANGNVSITWAPGHAIRDTAASPNNFVANSWNYSLVPSAGLPDVVINEIMADNLTGLADEDTNNVDWLEIQNRGATFVNLLGWSLTDDPALPGQWVFPAVNLAPGQFLVVFASGKNRATAGSNLHTSFILGPSEYLGLYNANLPRQVVSEFAPAYPEQRGDISWGRAAGGTLAYFATNTPGASNSTTVTYTGVVETPDASVRSGLFNQPFNLVLSCATPGAAIYFTTNNETPSLTNGTLYTVPIAIAGSSNKAVIPLRAAAFKTGLLSSLGLTRTYIFPDLVVSQPILPAGFPAQWVSDYPSATADTVGDYEMDPQVLTNGTNVATVRQALRQLPIVSIVTPVSTAFGPTNGVYSGRRKQGNQRPINAEMFLPDGTRVFQADCGWEVQGGSSPTDANGDWKDKKLSQRLIFKGDFGTPKLKAKVFSDTPVEEFDTLILDAGLNWWWTHMTDGDQRNRAKFITDTITSDLMNNSGMVAQHARYVHLYIDGLYWGLYFLHERMDEAAAASYFGGEKEQWDVLKHSGDTAGLQNGSLTNYNAMFAVARAGLVGNANYEQLQTFLDLPWFTDYMIVNFWVGNDDWPHHNWYGWHRRGPDSVPWRFVSWDAEHTFKNFSYGSLGNGNLNSGNSPGELFRLLTNNFEFRVQFGDRVHKLMFNGGPLHTTPNTVAFWSPTNPGVNLPATAYRKRVDEIWDSVVCESARWGDVATANANNPYTRELHYTRELNALFTITNLGGQTVNYFPLRGSNVLAQLRGATLYPSVAAPAFSQHGGRVSAGYSLRLTNVAGAGTVYFTTNGADPRLYGSGAVLAQAVASTGTPVSVGQSMTVKARTLNGTNWSALNEADFTVGSLVAPLRITEINYNPPGGDAYEFIELKNIGAAPLDVSGWTFEGVTFAFSPGSVIGAGAVIVLASSANTNAFAARYNGVIVSGYFGGALANAGERIVLKDATGRTVLSVDYDDEAGWPTAPDGGGATLEIVDVNGDPDAPGNWRASAVLYGTPGQGPAAPPPPTIVLNEIMAENLTALNHGGTFPDWVELYNAGGASVDLTGWSLSDDGDPRKFVFTSGPTLQPGDYLVVWCDATTNVTPGLHTGFALSKGGDNVFLYNAATSRVDAVTFGLQLPDYTLGRVAGTWQLAVPTTNAVNMPAALAAQTKLSINEWLANAAPGGSDWVELYNRAALPVSLQGIHVGTSNALFQLRGLSFLGANSFVQLLADEQPGPAHLDFKLPSTPNLITLSDSAGLDVDRAAYGAQIEGVTQGRLPDGNTNVISFAGSASPGGTNYLATYAGPTLNEVLAVNHGATTNAAGRTADFVELINTNGASASVAGMRLSTDAGDSAQWVFPTGASVPGSGHLVVWFDGERPASSTLEAVLNTGRSLEGRNGAVYLFGVAGQLVDSVAYGFQVENLSIGRSGGAWRLLAAPTPAAANSAAATLGISSSLRVNEWMANPADGNDWFELFNTGTAPVELAGLYVTDDPSVYGIAQNPIGPLSFIGGRDFVKFEADGDISQGRDHVNFNLDGDGDTLRLYTAGQVLIDAVDFGRQQPGVSQGRLPDGTANVVSFPDTATPDASNYLPVPGLVVNEVLPRAAAPATSAIELFNPTLASRDVSGWFLSNQGRDLKRYRIPNSTSVPLTGFLVIPDSQFNSGAATTPFALEAARGGEVWLSEADGAGNLTGYRAMAHFGAAETNVAFGRYQTSSGTDFTALSARTFDAANAYPKVGPLVLTELMYHPPDVTGTNDNIIDEFIEIRNTSGASVDLFDASLPTNRWRVQAGVDFTFPAGVSLPAGSNLLVVNFDPVAFPAQLAAFRSKYSVGASVPVFGPYDGKLDNDGESVELAKPSAPESDGFVPYILVDRVAYSDSTPWAAAAATSTNGLGASLQRVSLSGYGNDATNWIAGVPTAGGLTGPAVTATPTITQQPQNKVGPAGTNITLGVVASGGAPLRYQWRFNGAMLVEATNATLVISNLQPVHEGSYAVLVSNPAGSVLSETATVVVGALPSILQQPQTQAATVGATVSFNVVATGGNLGYQWRFYGTNLSGITNTTLMLVNVQSGQAGPYSCRITNNFGAVVTVDAYLVLTPPSILAPPQSQTNYAGTPVMFQVTAAGDAPLSYQWRRQGTNLPGANGATFTLPSPQTGDAGDYTVVVSNPVGAVTSAVATLTIIVPIQITQQPQNVSGPAGTNVSFSVMAIGTGTLRYQWWFNDTNQILGATSALYSFTNAQLSHNGAYAVVVSDDLSSVTSSNAILTILARPTITVQPTNVLAWPGSNAVFFIEATGTLPINVRWRRGGATFTNGIILATPTNSTLIVTNVQLTNDGNTFNAVLTNIAGQAPVSATAILSVYGPPLFLSQPSNLTVNPGTNVTFSVMATGVGPLRYQWNFNGASLLARTNTSLVLSNVQIVHEGFYTATVTNRDGAITSTNALLTVVTPPVLSEPQWLGDGRFQFLLQGNIYRAYTIDAGAPPSNWTAVGTLNYTNGRMPFVDATASNALQRIYRARLVP